jgi:hypothetical protein
MMLSARAESIILSAPPAESMMLSASGHARPLTLRARSRGGGTVSFILVVALVKKLVDTVNAHGVLIVVVRDVAVIVILVVVVVFALSKGLIVAITLP